MLRACPQNETPRKPKEKSQEKLQEKSQEKLYEKSQEKLQERLVAMPDETWFRGEGAGVAPNEQGKNLPDFGDGLYLSDKEDVALQYARLRAPGDNSWQVLEATIDRQSLGKILDLTTDPRWQRFMTQPMYPGPTIRT
jgi:hypothetical protein